jgi:hypothetical protein
MEWKGNWTGKGKIYREYIHSNSLHKVHYCAFLKLHGTTTMRYRRRLPLFQTTCCCAHRVALLGRLQYSGDVCNKTIHHFYSQRVRPALQRDRAVCWVDYARGIQIIEGELDACAAVAIGALTGLCDGDGDVADVVIAYVELCSVSLLMSPLMSVMVWELTVVAPTFTAM